MKKMVCKLIWKIAGISPSMGNLVMDILGEKTYCKVAHIQKEEM